MAYLINLSLKGKKAVVVGAGLVASRKVRDLLATGASVTVIAPEVCGDIQKAARAGTLSLAQRRFVAGDLRGAFIAVSATNDEGVNGLVAEEARASGCLINVVDRPSMCDFTVPATLRRGELTMAVTTEGGCPTLAGILRNELASRYGEDYGPLTIVMGQIRKALIAKGLTSDRIRKSLASLYNRGLLEIISARDEAALCALIREVCGLDSAISGAVRRAFREP